MKKILYIVPILLAALTSCQKEEGSGDGTDAVTINATIGKISEGIPLTRVNSADPDATKWDVDDQIAVSNGGEFVKYTYAGSDAWTAEADKFLKWSSPTMTFNAYYPARRNLATDMGNFRLFSVQSTAEYISATDYMTYSGSNTKPASGSAVNLALTRKTARVILNVTFANEFGTTPAPSVGELYVLSAYSRYTNGVPAGDPLSVNPFRNSTVSENQFIALVIPSATSVDLRFIGLEIHYGESNSKSKYVFLQGIPVMGAGKSYTYNLIAGKDKLEVASVTVEDWASGGVIPGGEATTPLHVDAGTVITDALIAAHIFDGKLTLTGTATGEQLIAIRNYFQKTPSVTQLDYSQLTELPNSASLFGILTSLTTIKLPASTKTLSSAFEGCTALTTIEGLATVETLAGGVFSYCANLASVDCPKATYLSNGLFEKSENLTEIRLTAESFTFVRSFKGNGDIHYDPFTNFTKGNATLYLHANQKSKVVTQGDQTYWKPFTDDSGYDTNGYKEPVVLTGFKAVYCGNELVYEKP